MPFVRKEQLFFEPCILRVDSIFQFIDVQMIDVYITSCLTQNAALQRSFVSLLIEAFNS